MATNLESEERYAGTSAKALKLLGLSKLPPDATRSQHLALIRQHRSVRKERAKSSSPNNLQRAGSSSRLRPPGLRGDAEVALEEDSLSPLLTPSTCRHSVRSDQEATSGGEDDSEDYCSGAQPTDPLNVKGATLKLAATDVDDQFLTSIAKLMSQFPEPPTREPTMDLISPAAMSATRSRRADRRGINSSLSLSHWRGGGWAGERPHHHRHQNPLYQQAEQQQERRKGRGGVREEDVPIRILYSQEGDSFEL